MARSEGSGFLCLTQPALFQHHPDLLIVFDIPPCAAHPPPLVPGDF
jgi:hypothetical protein